MRAINLYYYIYYLVDKWQRHNKIIANGARGAHSFLGGLTRADLYAMDTCSKCQLVRPSSGVDLKPPAPLPGYAPDMCLLLALFAKNWTFSIFS